MMLDRDGTRQWRKKATHQVEPVGPDQDKHRTAPHATAALAHPGWAEPASECAARPLSAFDRHRLAYRPAAEAADTYRVAGNLAVAEGIDLAVAAAAGTARDHLEAEADRRRRTVEYWEAGCDRATPCAPARRLESELTLA